MKTVVAWTLGLGFAMMLLSGCDDQKKEPPVTQAPSQPPPAYPGDAAQTGNQPPVVEAQPMNEPPPPTPEPEPVDTAAPRKSARPSAASGSKSASGSSRKQAPKESYSKSKAAKGGRTYTVKKGDTLQEISQKFYGTTKSWRRIYKANEKKIGSDPNKLVEGAKLSIP